MQRDVELEIKSKVSVSRYQRSHWKDSDEIESELSIPKK